MADINVLKNIDWTNHVVHPEVRIKVSCFTTNNANIFVVFINNILIWRMTSVVLQDFDADKEQANSIATLSMHILAAVGIGTVELKTI
jgi:hypothetical protein